MAVLFFCGGVEEPFHCLSQVSSALPPINTVCIKKCALSLPRQFQKKLSSTCSFLLPKQNAILKHWWIKNYMIRHCQKRWKTILLILLECMYTCSRRSIKYSVVKGKNRQWIFVEGEEKREKSDFKILLLLSRLLKYDTWVPHTIIVSNLLSISYVSGTFKYLTLLTPLIFRTILRGR